MNRIVYALSGWRTSGKDTAADLLVREFGFNKLSFAAKLKDMVARDYNLPREWFDTAQKEAPLTQYPVIPGDSFAETLHELLASELKSGFWTPRALCILEGSAKRSVHSNYWVRSVASEILSDTGTRDFVISDLRYKSEADTLKLLIPTIRLVRIERYDTIETRDPSERDLDDFKFDAVLQNKGTVTEFLTNVLDMHRRIL